MTSPSSCRQPTAAASASSSTWWSNATVDASSVGDDAAAPTEMLADRGYEDIDLAKLTVGGYGYRWICLRREFSL